MNKNSGLKGFHPHHVLIWWKRSERYFGGTMITARKNFPDRGELLLNTQ